VPRDANFSNAARVSDLNVLAGISGDAVQYGLALIVCYPDGGNVTHKLRRLGHRL
jgi:hypothetical protein